MLTLQHSESHGINKPYFDNFGQGFEEFHSSVQNEEKVAQQKNLKLQKKSAKKLRYNCESNKIVIDSQTGIMVTFWIE